MKTPANPTKEFYDLFQFIYNYYNEHLYAGELPNCMIVITRRERTFGYFMPERWVNKEQLKSDEIAINPMFFGSYPLIEMLQTLVHEMCHLWQHHYGKQSARSYHNQQWGEKMEGMGLMPSNTGKPGGKKTGQQMMDYPIADGLFLTISKKLTADELFKSLWYDRFTSPGKVSGISLGDVLPGTSDLNDPIYQVVSPDDATEQPTEAVKKRKSKYTCTSCNSNVWGKQGLNIMCGECKEQFSEQPNF